MNKSEQIEAIKRLMENIETYLQYADGPAYYNDLERLRDLRAELKELEENEEWKTFWVGFLFRFFSPLYSF